MRLNKADTIFALLALATLASASSAKTVSALFNRMVGLAFSG